MTITTLSVREKKEIHVVSFSGGRTSAYLVKLMEHKRKKFGWEVYYTFMDTGAEHKATYDFIRNIVKYWGIKLTCIRVKVNPTMNVGVSYEIVDIADLKPDLKPWRDMVEKYGVPTVNTPFCTSRLKQEPHDKLCDEWFGRGNYTTWLGIRADEPNRLTHFSPIVDMFDVKKKMLRPIRYLAEISQKGKKQINDWWLTQPFNLELEPHMGNCVYCIKKVEPKLIAAAKQEPQMALEFNAMLHDPSVRRKSTDKYPHGVIYRGMLSLDKVIKLAEVIPKENLDSTMADYAFTEEDDPSFCSESCEIFSNVITDVHPLEAGEQLELLNA
ncbi:MAG: hypothetical protein ACI92O_000432 [Colwellia sp.]|jgi:hypothetical protein